MAVCLKCGKFPLKKRKSDRKFICKHCGPKAAPTIKGDAS